ncbi:hypothetical protein LZ683_07810 [Comamonas testosteroni]|uniref:hypothetical protein n=1 Tax=Comamonas testosteroni TaxID=285 RepID=UPI0023AAA908|nr:hypothetical protein [Comamonas testosteroni]WEE79264.1 hypothetical protein LZ683_07810 [Comamonas testosteroni]
MAPFSLNLVVGQDRQHLLSYGRAAFAAGKESAGQRLHQIQEPASVSNATSQAAPAAVAVPDGAMSLLEALESMVEVCEGHDFDGAPSDAHMEKARAAISAYRAELAATPAAGELAPLQVGLQEPALVVLPEEIPASNTLWMFLTKGMTQSAIAGMPERDRKVLTERAQENWAAIRAEVGATVPVVLPEPFALYDGEKWYADEEAAICSCANMAKLQKVFIESQLHTLLAGVSAPAAQPERKYICPVRTIADLVNNLMLMDQALPIYGAQYIEHPPGKRRAIAVPPTVSIERVKDSRWIGEGEALNTAIVWTRAEQPAAPQAQADARDADGEAFRIAARLGLTLRFYGNCAQSGMPGAPSVYEVTPGPNNAEAMRASIARADAAIAAQAAQQGDAA